MPLTNWQNVTLSELIYFNRLLTLNFKSSAPSKWFTEWNFIASAQFWTVCSSPLLHPLDLWITTVAVTEIAAVKAQWNAERWMTVAGTIHTAGGLLWGGGGMQESKGDWSETNGQRRAGRSGPSWWQYSAEPSVARVHDSRWWCLLYRLGAFTFVLCACWQSGFPSQKPISEPNHGHGVSKLQ